MGCSSAARSRSIYLCHPHLSDSHLSGQLAMRDANIPSNTFAHTRFLHQNYTKRVCFRIDQFICRCSRCEQIKRNTNTWIPHIHLLGCASFLIVSADKFNALHRTHIDGEDNWTLQLFVFGKDSGLLVGSR